MTTHRRYRFVLSVTVAAPADMDITQVADLVRPDFTITDPVEVIGHMRSSYEVEGLDDLEDTYGG